MKKEHKYLTGVGIGVTVIVVGGLLAWGRGQSSTDADQNVVLERVVTKQEAMAVDIGELKDDVDGIQKEQVVQGKTLAVILTEVKKRNGGD